MLVSDTVIMAMTSQVAPSPSPSLTPDQRRLTYGPRQRTCEHARGLQSDGATLIISCPDTLETVIRFNLGP